MTVSSIVPVNTYKGNSSNTKFDFDFLIENQNELIVTFVNENEVRTVLKEGIDYSINEIGNSNGSYIIFPLATSEYNVLSENERIVLSLSLDIKQESEFKNSSFFNLSVLEWTFDYIVRIIQIINEKIERCVKVQIGADTNADELMESINENSNKIISTVQNISQVEQNIKNINDEILNINENVLEEQEKLVQKVNSFYEVYDNCIDEIKENSSNFLKESDTEYISGLGRAIDKYIQLTVGATQSNYTAPANGWFTLVGKKTTTGQVVVRALTSERKTKVGYSRYVVNGANFNISCPVLKDDVIAVDYDGTIDTTSSTDYFFRFYYAQGVSND
jgi:hypothetical protein